MPLAGKDTEKTIAAGHELFEALVRLIYTNGRIDLFGCNILKIDPFLVTELEDEYEVNFTASDDETGNLMCGGDWIMESDGIDIVGDYFDKEYLKQYRGVLLSFGAAIGKKIARIGARSTGMRFC